MKLVPLALLASASGCVLPHHDVSGVELSWFFAEVNEIDGDEARRLRSCSGARATNVDVEIVDTANEDREQQFSWECEEGYRTPEEFFTGASDAFVELRPGTYELRLVATEVPAVNGEDGAVAILFEGLDEVEIGSGDATLFQWELAPAPVEWTLDLTGSQACANVALTLAYADPEASLPEWEPDPEDPEALVVYRSALATKAGLPLAGEPTPCADLVEGPQLVSDIDRGSYILSVAVDDEPACRVDVVIDERSGPLALDLGALPC